jgi:hypothetical protein
MSVARRAARFRARAPILAAALFAAACGRESPSEPPAGQWVATGLWAGRVLILPDENDARWPADAVTINSVALENDSLVIAASYGGGCAEHRFDLLAGPWMESYPVQVRLRLAHDSDDDPCDAWLSGTLRFDLAPLREAWIRSYQATTGTIVLRIVGSSSGVTWTF